MEKFQAIGNYLCLREKEPQKATLVKLMTCSSLA